MRKRVLPLLLTACLLAGCSLRVAGTPAGASMPGPDAGEAPAASMPALWGWDDLFGREDPGGGSFAPWPGAGGDLYGFGEGFGSGADALPDYTLTETQRAYGSVGLISWPSVLVSIYLDEQDGESWNAQEIARSRAQLATAVAWLQQQCAGYHARPAIHYDDGTPDSGLFVQAVYDGRLAGGEDSEESESLYTMLDELCASLDTAELRQRYGTSSIGFAVFLPVAGSSFSLVHEYDTNYGYYEYSCLYQYDAWAGGGVWEGPTVYAHELLHLYGAPDLYEGSSDPYVTPELTQYVGENWPDAIMVDTYAGFAQADRVDKTLCPLTAYRLGLCRSWPGQQQFPDAGAAPAGTFTYSNEPVYWDRGDTAA